MKNDCLLMFDRLANVSDAMAISGYDSYVISA